jgi:hypothetical protein
LLLLLLRLLLLWLFAVVDSHGACHILTGHVICLSYVTLR